MLLSRNLDRLRPHHLGQAPTPDRVGATRHGGTPEELREKLVVVFGADVVLHKISDFVRFASDASPYRFVPRAVTISNGIGDIAAVFRFPHEHSRTVVFGAGGSSLNGQSQGEDILVDVRRHWTRAEMIPGTDRAKVLPGNTIARTNAIISRYNGFWVPTRLAPLLQRLAVPSPITPPE